MDGYNEDWREERTHYESCKAVEPHTVQDIPRRTQRTPGNGYDVHELLGEHAGHRQRGNTNRPKGYGTTSGA